MKTIYDIFKGNIPWKSNPAGEYGIEIETETNKASAYPSDFLVPKVDPDSGKVHYPILPDMPMWKAVDDGSLRNFGVEFVLKEPLMFEDALTSLDVFSSATKNVRFLKDAPATSVHVHMNVLGFTLLELMNLLTLLYFVENLLTEYSGPSRRSNTFARPMRCAEGALRNLEQLVNNVNKRHTASISFSENNVKYGTINLATMCKYGSIEIRCFRGTTDVDEIKAWIRILDKIYRYARITGLTPKNFYDAYRSREFEMIDDIFGDLSMLLKSDGWKHLVRRNEWYLVSIAMMHDDWHSFGSAFEKKEKIKDMPKFDGPPAGLTINSILGIGIQASPQPWTIEPVAVSVDEFPEDNDLDLPDYDDEDEDNF